MPDGEHYVMRNIKALVGLNINNSPKRFLVKANCLNVSYTGKGNEYEYF